MKKLIYEAPEMEIVRFDTADIITTSSDSPCVGIGPDYCPGGGGWNGGGCSAGDGSTGGTGCSVGSSKDDVQ